MQSCQHPAAGTFQPGQAEGGEKQLLQQLLGNLDQPEAIIEEVVVGPSLMAIKAGDRVGLSSHLGSQPEPDQGGLAQSLVGQSCAQAAQMVLQDSAFAVALGMAALNAGLLPQAGLESRPIQEVVAELAGDGEAALVGQFPFTGWLRDNVKQLHLFELRPVDERLPRDEWDATLARVKVAAITSTVFLTRHAHYYLSRAKNASRILIGPSTPLCPALFEAGVDLMAGSLVSDPGLVLGNVAKGGCFSALVKGGGIEFVVLARPGLAERLRA